MTGLGGFFSHLLGGGGAAPPPASLMDPDSWTVGPIVDGRNYSSGVALRPLALAGGGFAIDIPPAADAAKAIGRPPGSVHYVTARRGPLTGKARIVMAFTVTLAEGAEIVAVTAPPRPSLLTLYLGRAGDDWSGEGRFEAYRWWAEFATLAPIAAGDHRIVAPLDARWSAVERSNSIDDPEAFEATLADSGTIGFTLGGGTGYGHGVAATGPAQITVTDFHLE